MKQMKQMHINRILRLNEFHYDIDYVLYSAILDRASDLEEELDYLTERCLYEPVDKQLYQDAIESSIIVIQRK
ncbi:MAG TPA: hypothetical protein PKI14_01460 [Fervidobacterium sp.]|nr:hypothetical protein [Fervidobacterium sp.]